MTLNDLEDNISEMMQKCKLYRDIVTTGHKEVSDICGLLNSENSDHLV